MTKHPPSTSSDSYEHFLSELKMRIRVAQIEASLAVNLTTTLLYWQIGREILQRQERQGWGTKVISQLAKDLKREFPDMRGFSRSNLTYMRAFAKAWPEEEFIHQLGGQIPWKHNCAVLDKLKEPDERRWYIRQTVQNGWSRNALILQMETDLYRRLGDSTTNFERTLPKPQSELAQQIIKDPYNFDFLTIRGDAFEREIERGLVEHIRDFLLELGVGFAFIGSQYPVTVDEKEYRLDLLFYHTRLHCYVVIDLKIGEFEPEHSGKMNFYVSAVNHLICSQGDNPTIGIILCRSKKKNTVEFALDTVHNPIGVSTYTLQGDLPPAFKDSLPTAGQLEMELEAAAQEIESYKQRNISTVDESSDLK